MKQYDISDPWIPPAIQLNWTRHTAWGNHISRLMLAWMLQFRWPKHETDEEIAAVGISWYELVLSFMKFSGMFFPLRRIDSKGREILIPFKNRQEVDAYNCKFSEFANTFAIYYLQFTGLLSVAIWPNFDRKLVKSVFVQGAQIFTSGFSHRPAFPHQAWVYTTLKPFLKVNTGTAFTALPEVDWQMTAQDYKTLQTDPQGDWKSRSMAARRQMKAMRKWREQPMERIHFGSN